MSTIFRTNWHAHKERLLVIYIWGEWWASKAKLSNSYVL